MMHKTTVQTLACCCILNAGILFAQAPRAAVTLEIDQSPLAQRREVRSAVDGRVRHTAPFLPEGLLMYQSEAYQTDPFEIYHFCFQRPHRDIDFFTSLFRQLRHRDPEVLKEDGGLTGWLSALWVESHDKRRAVVVDADKQAIEWGLQHRHAHMKKHQQQRLRYEQADVLDKKSIYPQVPKSDIVCNLNWRYSALHSRPVLKKYFENAYYSVRDDGLFVIDAVGGLKPQRVHHEHCQQGPCSYEWDYYDFNPLTSEYKWAVHPFFKDGSSLDDTVTGHYRLWSVRELTDLLKEVGFKRIRIFEKYPETGQSGKKGTAYHEIHEIAQQDVWYVYIVAEK